MNEQLDFKIVLAAKKAFDSTAYKKAPDDGATYSKWFTIDGYFHIADGFFVQDGQGEYLIVSNPNFPPLVFGDIDVYDKDGKLINVIKSNKAYALNQIAHDIYLMRYSQA